MAEELHPCDISGRKLMIAIPCYDGKVNIKTAFALAQLIPDAEKYGVSVQLAHLSGCSLITKARNMLVATFMESDCTDLLFVDADVVINPRAVLQLLALSTDKDITSGMYPRRGSDRKFFLDFYLNEKNEFEFDHYGMMRVKNTATGFMLIRRHVLEHMIAKHPEWQYKNDVHNRTETALFDLQIVNGEYYGEDYLFCMRAREDGFKVFIDPSISLPHIGTEEFARDFEEDVLKPMLAQYCTPQLKVAYG